MKNHSPSRRPDLALQASREAARQITAERREGVTQLLKRDGHASIDDFVSAAQARMLTRGRIE